jgi:hypothetical protein
LGYGVETLLMAGCKMSTSDRFGPPTVIWKTLTILVLKLGIYFNSKKNRESNWVRGQFY